MVRRVVVLTHRRSRLGATRDLTVRVGTSAGYVLSLVGDSPDDLGAGERAELERLIRRDHDFRSKSGRPGKGSRHYP
jgi:hypothetical protein